MGAKEKSRPAFPPQEHARKPLGFIPQPKGQNHNGDESLPNGENVRSLINAI
jgi:hypothetical protein